jgi:hypothetical protein
METIKDKFKNGCELTFSTNLNETITKVVRTRYRNKAIKKIKKEFPSAFNFR